MDEPTSSLPRQDVERLFGLIGRLRADGVAVVYISHFLEEVRAIADDLAILRDGRTVWTGTADQLTDSQIISHMVGRDVAELFPSRQHRPSDRVRLEADGVSVAGRVREASLRVRGGEVLGIAGLVGAGSHRVAAWADGSRATIGWRSPVSRWACRTARVACAMDTAGCGTRLPQ